MENLIIYLLKVSALLTIFFLAYHFLLRKETFFNTNRWFLLLGIATSLLLPFFVYTKIIWVEPIVVDTLPVAVSTEDFQAVVSEPTFEINWWQIVGGIYLAGVFFFTGRFAKDFFSLFKILKHQKASKQGGFKHIDTTKIKSPFSFFNYIIYNSAIFSDNELQNIIEHEKVHSSQMHSADMVFSQLFCVAFWFNPFAWLHQKAIAQNLEFIADSQALRHVSDKIIYQKTLLKVSAPNHCIPITNHFYQSLIKKRIFMLNKNQSKKRNSWKYATVLPLLGLFVMQFQVETIAQTKEKPPQYTAVAKYSEDNSAKKIDGIMILPTTSDKDLKQYAERFSKDNNVTLKIENVKRNSNGEITEISILYDNGKSIKGNKTIKSNGKPISSILISSGKLSNGDTSIIVNNLGTDDAAIGRVATAEEVEAIAVAESGENVATATAEINNGYGYSTSFKTLKPENAFQSILENNDVNYKNAYILINGKEATPSDLEKMDPTKFSGSSVMNGSEVLAKKFGSKAINGVILLETTDFAPIHKVTATEAEDAKNFKIGRNSGFVIHKKSEESDFEFYKETLAKSGITFEYSSVKRNSSGEIIGMKLKLERKSNGNNENVSWNTKSDKPIFDVFIGEREGKLAIVPQKAKVAPKIFEVKNGDQIVLFDGDKLKIPGIPTIFLERTQLLIDGKNADLSKVNTLKSVTDVKVEYANESEKVVKKLNFITK